MLPIKALPILERWDCAGCARCCRGSIIRLDDEDVRRLRQQAWERQPDFRDIPPLVREGWFSSKFRLAQQPDGSCVFLTPEGRCRIHAKFGPDAKPLVCRMFPLQLVPRENNAILTLRRACPTAAADSGTELNDYRPLARQIAAEGRLLEENSPPPTIVGRHRRTWEDWLAVAKWIERLLTDTTYPLVRRVVHGLQFCALLEQAQLRTFSGDKLMELGALLHENSTDVGDLFSERTAPSAAVATLFRQTAAEYLRLHPALVARDSWRERWRMARAAVAFARGQGTVPRFSPALPATTFAALENPLGHLSEAVQRPFTRFFETHAMSVQYALVSRPGWSLVENYRALALSLPVGLWLLRYGCAERSPTVTDAIDVVTIMDRGQGYAPLVSSNHRSRIAVFARLNAIEQLAAWYAR